MHRDERRLIRATRTGTPIAIHVLVGAVAVLACGARADEPEPRWERGEPRPFLSAVADAGNAEHLALAAGYGKPHDVWAGLLAQGFLTSDFGAARFGGKLDLQAIALEAGVRATRSWRHLPLPDVGKHDSLPSGGGFASRVLDLSASGGLPLGPGFVTWEVLAVRLLSSHGDAQLFDEMLRVVYRPPWLATATAGWLASLRGGALLAGASAQWAFETGRAGDPFVRAGPVVYWRAWPHVALVGEVLVPVSSPDRLRFIDTVTGFVVLSFTAATGDPPPRFP